MIDTLTNKVLVETSHIERDNNCGNIYYKNNVYYFCRLINNKVDKSGYKYNTLLENWTQLADFPEFQLPYSSLIVENKILLTGLYIDCIYSYCPDKNNYKKILNNFNKGNKGLLKYKEQCFLLYENKIFETDNEFKNLKKVGDFNYFRDVNIKESIETKDSILFRDAANIFKLDILTKEITCICDVDYSKNVGLI